MSLETHPPQGAVSQLVSALPSSPYDGQECYYLADASAGIVWHLRYRAASSSIYKWEVFGGSSLAGYIAAQEPTSSGVYVDLATVGPSVTAPLAGDYDIAHGAAMVHNTASAFMGMSYSVGATAALDTDWAVCHEMLANMAQETNTRRRKTVVVAGSAIVTKYRTSGGIAQFSDRWLWVTPIRVG